MEFQYTLYIVIYILFHRYVSSFSNLARSKHAFQSSTYAFANASSAVDGNRGQNYYTDTCAQTATTFRHTASAWWTLDLGQRFNIYSITIYHRIDARTKLTNFYVYLSEEFNQATPNSGYECYHHTGTDNPYPIQDIQCNHAGRYVVLYKESSVENAYIQLCEVEAYGCNDGWYGSNCNETCSPHCSSLCNIRDFTCQCKPGYIGDTCTQKCQFPSFGINCNDTCHCLNMTSCDNVDGICIIGSCDRGWNGSSCNQINIHEKCENLQCNQSCQCRNNGYYGMIHLYTRVLTVEQQSYPPSGCPSGAFGYDCTEVCTSCTDRKCDPENGLCSTDASDSKITGNNTCTDDFEWKTLALILLGLQITAVIVVVFVILYRKRPTQTATQQVTASAQFSSNQTEHDDLYEFVTEDSLSQDKKVSKVKTASRGPESLPMIPISGKHFPKLAIDKRQHRMSGSFPNTTRQSLNLEQHHDESCHRQSTEREQQPSPYHSIILQTNEQNEQHNTTDHNITGQSEDKAQETSPYEDLKEPFDDHVYTSTN